MINSLKIQEFKNLEESSPLRELSKEFKVLSDRELNKSICAKRLEILPRSNGEWIGESGNSIWKPDESVIPKDKNYSNEGGKTWGELLNKYNISGISFVDGKPDFSDVSKGIVEIDNFSDERYGAGGNFDQAFQKLAEQRACSKQKIIDWCKENNYTWHECNDCKTMEKVPREIHGNIPHSGGISTYKNNY